MQAALTARPNRPPPVRAASSHFIHLDPRHDLVQRAVARRDRSLREAQVEDHVLLPELPHVEHVYKEVLPPLVRAVSRTAKSRLIGAF